MSDTDTVIVVVFIFIIMLAGFIWQGFQIQNLEDNYVRKDEVEDMVYDIMAKSQDRDDQVQWAQVQWLTRLHIKHFPKDKQWLAPYKRYWDMHDLDLWQRWELER